MKDLSMLPFNTTLLGVVRGVADFYDMNVSDATLYGGSGHAFLMNIHPELCPSGPYVWQREGFMRLLRNLGLVMEASGFCTGGSNEAERADAETWVRDRMRAGLPCSMLNLENQLLTGVDATGFHTARPWPGMDFPPAHLSFGSWAELGSDIHLMFFSFRRTRPADEETIIRDGLRYAVELYDHPERTEVEGYAVGARAWANWIAGVRGGHGAEHGCWWNSTVWSECREKAADWLEETARHHPRIPATGPALAADYRRIAGALREAGNKEMPAAEKTALLESAREIEARCIERIREVST
jgi:hypothetical protein